jgi:GAF domain-containing protein
LAGIRGALSAALSGERPDEPLSETRSLDWSGERSVARIEAVETAGLFDAPREWAFDQITQLASSMLQAPVSLLTVIDARRQFFVSAQGLPEPVRSAREKPIETSYCRHVIESGAPVVITDASCNPLVSGIGAWQEGFVSYLGVPVRDHRGEVVASLSVADATRRAWTRQERAMLEGVARLLTRELENRAMRPRARATPPRTARCSRP